MKLRKNISLDTKTDEQLRKIAEEMHCSVSQAISNLVWYYKLPRKEKEAVKRAEKAPERVLTTTDEEYDAEVKISLIDEYELYKLDHEQIEKPEPTQPQQEHYMNRAQRRAMKKRKW